MVTPPKLTSRLAMFASASVVALAVPALVQGADEVLPVDDGETTTSPAYQPGGLTPQNPPRTASGPIWTDHNDHDPGRVYGPIWTDHNQHDPGQTSAPVTKWLGVSSGAPVPASGLDKVEGKALLADMEAAAELADPDALLSCTPAGTKDHCGAFVAACSVYGGQMFGDIEDLYCSFDAASPACETLSAPGFYNLRGGQLVDDEELLNDVLAGEPVDSAMKVRPLKKLKSDPDDTPPPPPPEPSSDEAELTLTIDGLPEGASVPAFLRGFLPLVSSTCSDPDADGFADCVVSCDAREECSGACVPESLWCVNVGGSWSGSATGGSCDLEMLITEDSPALGSTLQWSPLLLVNFDD